MRGTSRACRKGASCKKKEPSIGKKETPSDEGKEAAMKTKETEAAEADTGQAEATPAPTAKVRASDNQGPPVWVVSKGTPVVFRSPRF